MSVAKEYDNSEMSVDKEYNSSEKYLAFFKQLGVFDWVFTFLLLAGSVYAYQRYSSLMDGYEVGILFLAAIGFNIIGWLWKPIRMLMIVIAALSLFAVSIYGHNLTLGETNFFLRFLISSQSAIMWMSALFVMATAAYFIELFSGNAFTGKVASAMTWSATTMGFVGLMVRWRESYLLGADIGHIPVSNLYEVFILFSIITALIYLYYEMRFKTRAMGGFVLLVISCAIGFLLWYDFAKGASEIKPLVPALQSYWMKIHVPANFIGYGAFSLAAMIGVIYLIKDKALKVNPDGRVAMRLPSLDLLDDVMHKSIALGFAFFTIATVLGALWAAEAWGGYWSWDPKETWALIVWLNYAAWLHMRLMKGLRGTPLAWWAVIGLFVTLFAFLGVNMFLSGLHSYGEL
jgi:cytochrome c-type biogenesis protein CcsB